MVTVVTRAVMEKPGRRGLLSQQKEMLEQVRQTETRVVLDMIVYT